MQIMQNGIEDEIHLLLQCETLDNVRNPFLNKLFRTYNKSDLLDP